MIQRIIEEKAKVYKTEVNFGGKLIKIGIPEKEDTHDWILEIAAQMLATKELVMANDIRSRELLALAKKVATTNVTVFINGPTGTGKEVISNFIHNNTYNLKSNNIHNLLMLLMMMLILMMML